MAREITIIFAIQFLRWTTTKPKHFSRRRSFCLFRETLLRIGNSAVRCLTNFSFYSNFEYKVIIRFEKIILLRSDLEEDFPSDFPLSTRCFASMLRCRLVFGVVDATGEKFGSGGVVLDVEQERTVGDEFSWLASELVDQLDLGGWPSGCSFGK